VGTAVCTGIGLSVGASVGAGTGLGVGVGLRGAAIVAAAAWGFAGVAVLFDALLHPASTATARRGSRKRYVVIVRKVLIVLSANWQQCRDLAG
jgi:hypothetical protein